MKYVTDKNGKHISRLGFGCMRFTKNGSEIDYDKAEKELLYAIENGINYFDTAYAYPGNEECLGRFISQNEGVREKMYIATKLPQYIIRNKNQIDKIFKEELDRLNTDYIDYYLMHMFTTFADWENLLNLGMEKWIAERKAEGSIKNIGFSYHGDTDMFIKILNAYDWDFCQIQYNYLDEDTQAGRKGLKAAAAKGIPVIIMEPLRGGKLVNIPEKAKEALSESGLSYTPAELGLKWLWNQSEVACVLSGMNSLEMIEENVRIASETDPGTLTEKDFALVEKIKTIFREKEKVGCTACRYCMPCPKGVDIPGNFYYYNLMYMENKGSGRFGFAQNIGMREDPCFASQCVGCGKCEKHCPQHIPIREKLKEADKELRPLKYRLGLWLARKIIAGKRNKSK